MNDPFAGLIKQTAPYMVPVRYAPKAKPIKSVKHRRDVAFVLNPFGMTPSQCSVMPLLVQGYTMQEIGVALGVASKTVEAHIQMVKRKLGARNTAHAAVLWDRWVRARQETNQ